MALPFQDCIMLLGDSLSQRMDSPGNLHQRFAEAYQRKLDIQNRAFGGYNTAWGLPLLDHILAKKGDAANTPVIRLATIWYGTNDSVLEGREQYLPLSAFTENLTSFFHALTSRDSPYAVADTPVSIILITPGPPYHPQMAPATQATRSVGRTKQVRDETVRLYHEWKALEAKQELKEGEWGWKIALVDFWELLTSAAEGEPEGLVPFYFDGVHLTTKGYTLLWDKVSQTIKTEFKGRGLDYDDFDDLPRRAPLHSEVDHTRPQSVVERMALPRIRGGTGPIKVAEHGFEG